MKHVMTSLGLPALDPMPRTEATARIVSRLDRVAARALWVWWWCLNRALWVAVSVVLAVEGWKRVVDEPRSQWVRRTDRYGWDFHCAWCGGMTPEGEIVARTCCGMAMLEERRRNPLPGESW